MCPTGKSIAEIPAVMREARTWKLHVSAITSHVRSRLGSLTLAGPWTWLTHDHRSGYAVGHDAARYRRTNYEFHKTESVVFYLLRSFVNYCARSVGGSDGPSQ